MRKLCIKDIRPMRCSGYNFFSSFFLFHARRKRKQCYLYNDPSFECISYDLQVFFCADRVCVFVLNFLFEVQVLLFVLKIKLSNY